MGPADLSRALAPLPLRSDPRLIVSHETFDDAGVFRLSDDLALVQTVDFFAPIVDDPYAFGQVAAANVLSDVYAMGGEPLTALNLVGFPTGKVPLEVLTEILRGGQDKVHEAGAIIVGGHTVVDDEVKYGLAVTGRAHLDRLLTNAGARAGDLLILTKPLGTGIRALGHASHIARASGVTLRLVASSVPALEGARAAWERGARTGGAERNEEYLEPLVDWGSASEWERALLSDPQTSGGLLVAVPEARAADYLSRVPGAVVVGEVLPRGAAAIVVV